MVGIKCIEVYWKKHIPYTFKSLSHWRCTSSPFAPREIRDVPEGRTSEMEAAVQFPEHRNARGILQSLKTHTE